MGAWSSASTAGVGTEHRLPRNVAYASSSSFLGGHVMAGTTVSSWATSTFSGRDIAFVSTASRTRGAMAITIDGVWAGCYAMWSATTVARKVAFSKALSQGGTHRIQIRSVGTSGRPRIDLDAFIVVG